MNSLQTIKRSSLSQVASAGCITILERLRESCGGPVDLAAIRRMVGEAGRAREGRAEEHWWTWLVEAGASLGLRLRVVDASPHEAAQFVADGATVVTYLPQSASPWLLLQRCDIRHVRIERCADDTGERDESVERLRTDRLAAHLQPAAGAASNGVLRCVLLEPGYRMPQADTQAAPISPLSRLWAFMRLERSDIWIVCVFAMFVGLLTLATPVAVEALVNTVAFGRFMQPVVVLALILFAFLALAAAVRGLQTFVVEIIQRRVFVRMAAELAHRLPRVQLPALDGKHGPELVNRFFDVVTVQKSVAGLLLDGVILVLATVVGMGVLAFYHPWLLGFDLILLLLVTWCTYALGRGAVTTSVDESKQKYALADWLEEIMRCPTAFRTDGGPDLAIERTDLLSAEYLHARRKHFRVLMTQIAFALGLQAVASTVLLGLGGWLVISGQLTLGQLVAAELIVAVIVGAFAKMGKHLESFYDLLAAVDKLGVLIDLPLERADGILHVPEGGPARLQMQHLTATAGGGRRMFGPLDLDVAPGEHVGVAAVPAGPHSVLTDLIYGLRNPSSGQLQIDGLAPRDLRPDVLRGQVAVARNIEIFGGTILSNIHLERPGITAADVRETLEQVGLLDDVLSLPEGLDTQLAPGGYPLDDHQARRLMLARALVSRPRLLVIDGLLDAFPDDDLPSLTDALTASHADATLLIISGRRDVLNRCDRQIDVSPAEAPAETTP